MTDIPGKLAAIWIKRMKRGPMDAVQEAELVANQGILGNANQGGWRQVTIIEQEVWGQLRAELGADVWSSARRASLRLDGSDLANTAGKLLELVQCAISMSG